MNTKNNSAFYYIDEGYDIKGKTLMGRQSAGEGFLKGFARHAGVDEFYCYGPNRQQFQYFQRSIMQATGVEKSCSFIPFAEFSRLEEVGCYFQCARYKPRTSVRTASSNGLRSPCGTLFRSRTLVRNVFSRL